MPSKNALVVKVFGGGLSLCVVSEVAFRRAQLLDMPGLGRKQDSDRIDDIRLASVVLSGQYRQAGTERDLAVQVPKAGED
jgi:hypothetical protein